MPSRERLGRDPDCEAAPLLQRPVVRRPVADLVARPGDLVAARLIGLVGHRSSGERGSGPIRPTAALPKPRVAILHQRPRGCYEPSDLLTVRAKSPALTHEAGLFCSSQGENLAFPAFAFC